MGNRAKINPKMMQWARLRAGFTNGYEDDLPLDIKTRCHKWEKGDVYPTWKQLRKVSQKFNVPTAFFFMDQPPILNELPTLINYRKLDFESIPGENSPALIECIHKSERRRLIFRELLEELNEDVIKFEIPNLAPNKKMFSNYIRDVLDVSLETQKSWYNEKKHYSYLNNWKNIITKKLGVLIFETEGVFINEMRGLCIFHDEMPIILLNGKDSPNGRIFTLFHELTHLLLGESAICGDDLDRDIEIFCNSVAGEFLVPRCDLFENIDESGGNYLYNQIKYNGKPFYALILEAYDKGIITSLEFSKYSNLGQNQIPKLQEIFNNFS